MLDIKKCLLLQTAWLIFYHRLFGWMFRLRLRRQVGIRDGSDVISVVLNGPMGLPLVYFVVRASLSFDGNIVFRLYVLVGYGCAPRRCSYLRRMPAWYTTTSQSRLDSALSPLCSMNILEFLGRLWSKFNPRSLVLPNFSVRMRSAVSSIWRRCRSSG